MNAERTQKTRKMQKSDWKKYKFSALGKIITGKTPSTKKGQVFGAFVPFLTPTDITNQRKITCTARSLSQEGLSLVKNCLLPPNSICVTCIGSDMGKTVIADRDIITNQQINSIIINADIAVPLYVYYAFRARKQEFLALGLAGSTMPILNKTTFSDLEINLPPIEEQKRIAQILGALDDKIELLQKQNKTLEDMAKAIFKSWFVDFDVVHAKQKGLPKADIMREYHLTDELYDLFPSDFENSALGPIPLGWQVKTVQDLGEVVCGKTPSTSHKEFYGGNIPFITIPDMHDSVFANKTERYLTNEGEQSQPTKTLPPFSVCVSCIATPGLVTMTTTHSQTNQQINSVIPHNLEAKFYNYYVLRSVADQIRAQGSGGSVFVNLNKTAFSKIKVLWADQTLQELFTKESEIYFDKILNNLKQIQTLTELRDTLLPPLISGKIRV